MGCGEMAKIVDLRSDTVTLPTPAMRKAMYEAEVGDDVYGEDVTVNRLQRMMAERAGKEAGLFVASGTMGNQLAVLAHTGRGDELICDADAHIFYSEVGGIAALGGIQPRTIIGKHGILSAAQIRRHIRAGGDIHQPPTRLICLENTHNRAGGTCYPLPELDAIRAVADEKGVSVHMDGARVFHAAVAQKTSLACVTKTADSVSICIAKGLCAPVGAVLVGSSTFIERARRYRKMLGGGMRQAGILAAAGIVALETMVERLAEDHRRAKRLAEGFGLDAATIETNIVLLDTEPHGMTAASLAEKLLPYGVKASVFGEYALRFVTHHGIEDDDIEQAISAVRQFV